MDAYKRNRSKFSTMGMELLRIASEIPRREFGVKKKLTETEEITMVWPR
jgi:hypothetical protein